MVPADLLRSAPELSPAEGASTAALPLADGATAVVECTNGWALASETIDEREYYLLQTTPATGEDGSRQASLTVHVREDAP
jgi:hypothetical protein